MLIFLVAFYLSLALILTDEGQLVFVKLVTSTSFSLLYPVLLSSQEVHLDCRTLSFLSSF